MNAGLSCRRPYSVAFNYNVMVRRCQKNGSVEILNKIFGMSLFNNLGSSLCIVYFVCA